VNIENFYGFVYSAVSRVGEGAFLLCKESGAEEEECGGEFYHSTDNPLSL